MAVFAHRGCELLRVIRERAQADPTFRQELLREGLALCYAGDFQTGRGILRNYINATIGFPRLARATKISSPSLQRMFGPKGNPSAQNLFSVLAALQKAEGVSVELQMHAQLGTPQGGGIRAKSPEGRKLTLPGPQTSQARLHKPSRVAAIP
jgi:hypothetical protein